MKKKTPIVLLGIIVLIVAAAIVLLVMKGGDTRDTSSETEVPQDMYGNTSEDLGYPPAADGPEVLAANQYIIDQVGEEYFKENYTLFTSEFQGDTFEHWVMYEYAHPAEYSGQEEFVRVYVAVDDDFNVIDVSGEVACFYADSVCDPVDPGLVLEVLQNEAQLTGFTFDDVRFASDPESFVSDDMNYGHEWVWYVLRDANCETAESPCNEVEMHMVDAATGNYIGSQILYGV